MWSYFRRTERGTSVCTGSKGREQTLAAVNKWLIAHEDAEIEGAVNGLKGEKYNNCVKIKANRG